MKPRAFLFVALCALAAGQLLGANTTPCELSGTWYGFNTPYLMTATQSSADRFTVEFQLLVDVRQFGYLMTSTWEGEAIRTGPGTYDVYAMSVWIWDPAAAEAQGIDGSGPEVDVVHAVLNFQDCDTVVQSIDQLDVYFAFDPTTEIPFLSPPDLDALGGGTLEEVYKRMPTECCAPRHAKPENTVAPKFVRKR